jgi:hypothetical protein
MTGNITDPVGVSICSDRGLCPPYPGKKILTVNISGSWLGCALGAREENEEKNDEILTWYSWIRIVISA